MSRDRLRFALSVVPDTYETTIEDVLHLLTPEPWFEGKKERMQQSLESMEMALGVVEKEFYHRLSEEMQPFGGFEVTEPTIKVPEVIKAIFDDLQEEWFSKSTLDSLILSGATIAYWEGGFAGEPIYTVLGFPRNTDPLFVETWWGLGNYYRFPSYLTRVSEKAWVVTHVEN